MLFRPLRHLTLASFVPSPRNQRARAEGIRFVRAIRPPPDVLVIAGRAATGKTHLMHALANWACEHEAYQTVACLSAQQFSEEVMRGQFHDDLAQVLGRLAAQDLLMVDDVDRLTWQPKVANALLDVLEVRRQSNRRTLLSASLHPGAIGAHPLVDFLGRQPAVGLA